MRQVGTKGVEKINRDAATLEKCCARSSSFPSSRHHFSLGSMPHARGDNHPVPRTATTQIRLHSSATPYDLMATEAPSAPPNFARTVQGPTLIGVFFNLILYGIFLAQVQVYFSTFKQDRRWFKLFRSFCGLQIVSLVILETINSVFAMYYSYDRLVNNFGDMNAQAVSNWVFGMSPLTNGIIAVSVQIFFSWRVRVLTGKIWAMLLIVFLSVVSSLAAITVFFIAAILASSPTASAASFVKPVIIVWLVLSATADSLISTTLVYHLRKNRTGFVSTDDTLNKIIRLTVQTGIITSVWAILDLGVYLGVPTADHEIFNLALAKLYTNSLLSSLNSRQGWKYTSTVENTGGHSADRGHSRVNQRQHKGAISFSQGAVPAEVFVNIESHELRDVSLSTHPSDSQMPESYRHSPDIKGEQASL
ncbi:hypothetical protein EW146_g1023 [Bondarzewia mesenterica]|uniref:DUF6534 domain-containing protein n=1 Tax=Bondarzewia mesenterica TaxID=1095465 RepID=A0A4V3XG72_9AGAM|nr:hypothetical protein EW146_g1023 [Bondarzewia mesenterica]